MARDLEHLALPRWRSPTSLGANPEGGRHLFVIVVPTMAGRLDERTRGMSTLTFRSLLREASPAGIDPKLVFTIRLHPSGRFEDARA